MGDLDFSLSERKRELLLSAVEGYIENALPITSEKVQSTHFQTLSSATLRNELNSLEEMGYLKKLHTSSGRIPTTKAYRYYVDSIIGNVSFDEKMIKKVQDSFISRSSFLKDVVDEIAKKIQSVIDYPAVIQIEGYENLLLEAINIIPLLTGEALVLIKTNAGIINNTIKLKSNLTEENCKDASKFLSTNLANKRIEDIVNNFEDYCKLFKSQIGYFEELLLSITEMLKEFSSRKISMVARGNTAKLLEAPECKDVDTAKKFINVLENEEKIKKIVKNIDDNTKQDVVFSIGSENSEELDDYSIVKANYSLSNGIIASIGVVGPKRLDYARIASVLKFIADEVTKNENSTNQNKKD